MIAYTHYRSDPRVIRAAEAALSAGYQVDFLALRQPKDPPVEMVRGVKVWHLDQLRYRGGKHFQYLFAYLMFFWRCFWKSTALHFKHRYQVIHVNNMPDFLVFSTLIPRIFGAKVILDIHDPMPNTFSSKFRGGEKGFFFRILLWQELLSAWYSSRTVTVHDPVKYGVLVKHGLAAESIHVVANFPDTELFACRDSYPTDGPVRLVFHGTILERSGLRSLVLALAQVKQRDQIRAKIIGEGDFSATLHQLIAELGLQDMVEFDNKIYPVHEIPKRIADCNVGVIPLVISSITNHALPLKLLEYIAMGLPVLSVRSAAINHYFNDDDCLFYDWDKPESLAALLDRIAVDRELLIKYHRRSVALRERFAWSVEKAKYIAMLYELSGIPASQPAPAAALTSR